MNNKPLIVQSDLSLMLDVHDDAFEIARADIATFAELKKSPEHFHIYAITYLSIWNAAASGVTLENILGILTKYSRFPIPSNIPIQVQESFARYGRINLLAYPENENELIIKAASAEDDPILRELVTNKKVKSYLRLVSTGVYTIKVLDRGTVKQLFTKLGWPIRDLVPLKKGDFLEVNLSETVVVRDYQREASDVFLGGGRPGSGLGIVVLPCGSGKTIVGIDILTRVKNEVLILAANIAAGRQWIREILSKTDLDPALIGEYSGDKKEIRPITVATYQVLVWRKDKESEFEHFSLFRKRHWGLVIYDEAHLLPAPVFKITAEIQSVCRLGLTATLVREDGAEEDVFSLIGPKRFDMPWRDLENQGWIAEANCIEVKVSLDKEDQLKYSTAEKRSKLRIAAQNYRKNALVAKLLQKHKRESILIIGQYIDQLTGLAKQFGVPIITGKTPNKERDTIYNQFRAGDFKVLVVSKVANFSIDLPDASVAIQVSGAFGSRQEEAQRLGRILRPKECQSHFYSLVSRFTDEEMFSANRQKFLAEQGYAYRILGEEEVE